MNNTIFNILFIFVIGALIGWVINVINLSNCDFESPYKSEVIHAVGIIPPVGAILGWVYTGDDCSGDDDDG